MIENLVHPAEEHIMNIARRFSRRSETYDRISCVQRRSAARLFDMIERMHLDWHSLLDIGCGTGMSLLPFVYKHGDKRFVLNDVAENMLQKSRVRLSEMTTLDVSYLCGDASKVDLPLADIWYANFSLQWIPNALQFLRQHRARYKSLAVSVLLKDTFAEWSDLCAQYDVCAAPMIYPTLDEVLHFAREISDVYENRVYRESLCFKSVHAAMRYISDLGASYPGGTSAMSNLRSLLRHKCNGIKLEYHIAHLVTK